MAQAALGREREAEAPIGGCHAGQCGSEGFAGKALTSSHCAPLVRAQWRGVQRRDAVLRAMKGYPISQRRACVLIGVDSKAVRRQHPPDNPEIRLEMNRIAETRRRFGYPLAGNGLLANHERRRIGVML